LIKIDVKIGRQGRYNNACKLASLALKAARNNRETLYCGKPSTIACEVPIWLWEKNLDIGISSHIDTLQVRNGLVYILELQVFELADKK